MSKLQDMVHYLVSKVSYKVVYAKYVLYIIHIFTAVCTAVVVTAI